MLISRGCMDPEKTEGWPDREEKTPGTQEWEWGSGSLENLVLAQELPDGNSQQDQICSWYKKDGF